MEPHGLTVDIHLAGISKLDTRQNLHKGALTGPIGAKERMDLAVANGHINGPQSHDGSIRFCNIGSGE
jgi:hypothetical protein